MTEAKFQAIYTKVESFILNNGVRFVDDLEYDVIRALENIGEKPKARLVSNIVNCLYHNDSEVLAEIQ